MIKGVIMSFLKDERGQSAIEYIMLVGGVIISAIIVSVIYEHISKDVAENLNVNVNTTITVENKAVSEQLKGF